MRRLHVRLAAACVLAVATAVFTGSALAGGGHGNDGSWGTQGGYGQQQGQPQQQPSSGYGSDHHATEGQQQQQSQTQQQPGVKPSSSTQHWTHTTVGSKPDTSKRYGNGTTAAQIAASRGAPASQPLTGPGNSQPHKTFDCGHKDNRSGGVDVHAIKSYASAGCAASPQPQQQQEKPVYVSYCQHEGNRWVYKTTTTEQLAKIVQSQDVIAPSFIYNGHSYSKHWDSEGQSIFSHCRHSGSFTPPAAPAPAPQQSDKVTICHATGSASHPYLEITVDAHALKHGHTTAKGDIIPAPAGGCPAATPPVVPTVSFCENGTLMTAPATVVVASKLNGTDIVPPFTFNGQTYSANWPAGEATFDNHCTTPAPVVTPTTQATTTQATTTTAATTTVAATTTTTTATTATTQVAPAAATTTTTAAAAAVAPATPAGGVLGAQTSLTPKHAAAPRGGVLGTVANVAGTSLPFTGFPVWLAVLVALALILAGFALRRRTLGTRGL
ncbi:MAG: hypothetical protein ABUS54_00990 [Actinomycetota bacterium]